MRANSSSSASARSATAAARRISVWTAWSSMPSESSSSESCCCSGLSARSSRRRYRTARSSRAKLRCPGRTRYAASAVSEVTPSRFQPRPARSCMANFASCRAFGRSGIGEPRRQGGFVVGIHGGGVEVAALAVGGHDGQRGGVGVEREVGAHHGQAERGSPRCARTARPGSRPGSSAPPRTSKPSSTSGSAEASVSNSRSRSTRNSRSSNRRWIWSRSHGCIRSVSGVCASGTSLTRSVSSRLRMT